MCPDAETLAAWYDAGLAADERAQIDAHLSTCDRCQATVAMLVRTDVPAPTPARATSWLSWRWLAPIAAGIAAVAVWAVVRPQSVRVPGAPVPGAIVPGAPMTAAPVPSAPTAGAAATLREAAPVRGAAEARKAAPATPPPAEANEAKRADEQVAAAASPAAPAQPAAPASPPAPFAASRNAGARALQSAADLVAAPDISSPDPSVRWRIRGTAVERTTDAGATWSAQATGSAVPLAAGAAPSADVCWLVGRNGTVLRSVDGRTWQVIAFPERVDLVGVDAASATAATVTAADARRFTTDDGGATWRPGGLQE